MNYLQDLPQPRQAYYQQLSERIKERLVRYVDRAEWKAVEYFIEIHKTLEWCIINEKESPMGSDNFNCVRLILNIIETKAFVDPPLH